MKRDRREFFTGRGSGYEFADVLAHTGTKDKAELFLARMDDGSIVVMKPAYGHFKPSSDDPRDHKWM